MIIHNNTNNFDFLLLILHGLYKSYTGLKASHSANHKPSIDGKELASCSL